MQLLGDFCCILGDFGGAPKERKNPIESGVMVSSQYNNISKKP
jgi:hypothetical protein